MNTATLYDDLMLAFNAENLNAISRKLISIYKSKRFFTLREIINKIHKYYPIDEDNNAKCFSKLIMLCHPDKGEFIRNEITRYYNENNFEELNRFSYIFVLLNIDTTFEAPLDEEIDYNPQYANDVNINDGYNVDYDLSDELADEEFLSEDDYSRSFYNMIKIRVYGNTNIEFPPYYLHDFEEYEMNDSGLESLDGIEHCIHVRILDLANNEITDLENLSDLSNIEELYLANNKIGYIDALGNLLKLRILDLSDNLIDDISPIINLPNLEYIDLSGNRIPEYQLNILRENDIIIINLLYN